MRNSRLVITNGFPTTDTDGDQREQPQARDKDCILPLTGRWRKRSQAGRRTENTLLIYSGSLSLITRLPAGARTGAPTLCFGWFLWVHVRISCLPGICNIFCTFMLIVRSKASDSCLSSARYCFHQQPFLLCCLRKNNLRRIGKKKITENEWLL